MTKGSSVTTTTYTYDDANQLKTINGTTVQHDANGNLTKDGDRTYVYDAENRLAAVKDKNGNNIVTLTYRADGMRKTMTTSSGTITFHYDENNNVVYETDSNNQVVASYTYGQNNEPVSMTRGGQTYYYQLNGHGDVVALTNTSGTIVATYEYDAFGNLLRETGNVDNPYRYAGYRYDKETGLYYLQSRYYNPTTGRFLTRDTFEGFEDEPQSLNLYTYTKNSPVDYVDPDGHAAAVVGVYFIPGVGQVALLVTGVVILGVVVYKAGSWLGKKAKEYHLKAQNKKNAKKQISSLQKRIREHKNKIKKDPRNRNRKHWEHEIRVFEGKIKRLKKRYNI